MNEHVLPAIFRLDEAEADLPQAELVGVLRVVDAAANRVREGLRAVEDYVRFGSTTAT